MQSARHIAIPRRQHATANKQQQELHPCADLAPEWYGNLGPLTGLGIYNDIPVEDDFFDLFRFE